MKTLNSVGANCTTLFRIRVFRMSCFVKISFKKLKYFCPFKVSFLLFQWGIFPQQSLLNDQWKFHIVLYPHLLNSQLHRAIQHWLHLVMIHFNHDAGYYHSKAKSQLIWLAVAVGRWALSTKKKQAFSTRSHLNYCPGVYSNHPVIRPTVGVYLRPQGYTTVWVVKAVFKLST